MYIKYLGYSKFLLFLVVFAVVIVIGGKLGGYWKGRIGWFVGW